jgi:mono/diheme cytochrome c family protein
MPGIKLGAGLSALCLSACFITFAAQQTQTPVTPAQPPPGAANGPQPGPAVQAPGEGQRTGDTKQSQESISATEQEMARQFLAIGAAPDPAAVKRGQATFVSTCGFCHGSNAGGGATGPNLVRSVVVLHDAGTGKEIMPVIHNGRPGKGMPAFPNLSDAQIKDIAAFLQSRHQAAANRMAYKIQNIVTGDPKQGEEYFAAHCANCHSGTGDLAHIAAKYEPVALQGRFLYPKTSQGFGPGPPADPREQKTVVVKLSSGESYSGKLDKIDDFSVALTDANGEHRSWIFDDDKGIEVQVTDPLKAHAELLFQYTDADMHNLLAYLETMK